MSNHDPNPPGLDRHGRSDHRGLVRHMLPCMRAACFAASPRLPAAVEEAMRAADEARYHMSRSPASEPKWATRKVKQARQAEQGQREKADSAVQRRSDASQRTSPRRPTMATSRLP